MDSDALNIRKPEMSQVSSSVTTTETRKTKITKKKSFTQRINTTENTDASFEPIQIQRSSKVAPRVLDPKVSVFRPLPPPVAYLIDSSIIIPGYTSWNELVVHFSVLLFILCGAGMLLWAGLSVVTRDSWAITVPSYYAKVTSDGSSQLAFQQPEFNSMVSHIMGVSKQRVSSDLVNGLWLVLVENQIPSIVNASVASNLNLLLIRKAITSAPSGFVASLKPNTYLSSVQIFGQSTIPDPGAYNWENWPITLGVDSLTTNS